MNNQTIEQRVEKVLRQFVGETTEVNSESKLDFDLKIDSLERVEFAMDLEDEFSLEPIDDDEFAELQTFADVVAFVSKQKAAVPLNAA